MSKFKLRHYPDVVSFPEFCALNRWIYDPRGQIDMVSPICACLEKCFKEKKYFKYGPYGLRTDGGLPPVMSAMWNWIVAHLNPMMHGSTSMESIAEYGRTLTAAGYDISGWDDLLRCQNMGHKRYNMLGCTECTIPTRPQL